MGRKRFSPEQIIVKLREAEIIESKGLTQVEAAKKLGIAEQTIDPLAQGIWWITSRSGQEVQGVGEGKYSVKAIGSRFEPE